MTWSLRSSRNLFFATTRAPRENFWASHIPEGANAERVASPVARSLFEWDPLAPDARSNCPELHMSMPSEH